MKKEYKNYVILITTIFLVVLVTTRFTNVFGSNTDWINQHTVIPDYFRQLFYSTGKILPNFAFNYGAGQNIFNLSYYGFLSPLILAAYLFPNLNMTTYITVVNIIVLIVTVILFYRWLKNNNYDNNISLVTSLLFILASPLIFHMHRHIMFVNYMPFLIMSLMGVDRLIKENNKSFLVINIFFMIMTSYYYSVCGILVVGIYYLYQYLNNNKKIKIKTIAKDFSVFIFLVLIAVFMASILLLPTASTLLRGRGDTTSTINFLSLFIPYLKIHKIFCGTYAIGLSMIAFISLLYLFYTKKKNNIILATIISLILFTPIFMYILNGGLYLREKCFIPFLPIFGFIIAYFLNDLFKDKIKIKNFVIYLLIIIIPLYYFNHKEVCYLFFIGFIILLLIFNKYKFKTIIAIYLIFFALGNSIYENLKEDIVSNDTYKDIFNDKVEKNIDKTIENDNTYYRTNNLMYPTKTLNKIYNQRYYTTNIYSSTYNKNYLDFVRNVFKTSSVDFNYFMISGSNNILFNTFMGVKYLNSDYDPGLGYKQIDEQIYINENAFPIIYAQHNILNENEFDSYGYPYQEELLLNNVVVKDKNSTNKIDTTIEKILLDYEIISNDGVDIKKEENSYVLTVEEKGYLIIKLNKELKNKILFINIDGLKENSCSYNNISMKINNVENILTCQNYIYPNKNNTFRYVISDETINQLKIELSKGIYNIDNIETYILSYENIKDTKNNLEEFKITNFLSDTIKGKINIKKDSYLVTSIPYDKGFTIKVNGEEIKYEKVNKSFIGFPIKQGDYEIEFTYNSPLLKEGKIISLIGIFIFVIILISDLKKRKQMINC